MAAHGRVNGRGPAKLGGMSEAKVFESKVASLEAKAFFRFFFREDIAFLPGGLRPESVSCV